MKLNVEHWKEFRLGDLFCQMYKAKAHVKGDFDFYSIPSKNTIRFISRTAIIHFCTRNETNCIF